MNKEPGMHADQPPRLASSEANRSPESQPFNLHALSNAEVSVLNQGLCEVWNRPHIERTPMVGEEDPNASTVARGLVLALISEIQRLGQQDPDRARSLLTELGSGHNPDDYETAYKSIGGLLEHDYPFVRDLLGYIYDDSNDRGFLLDEGIQDEAQRWGDQGRLSREQAVELSHRLDNPDIHPDRR